MNLENKVRSFMENELGYAYCDNCGTDDDGCEDCHRKSISWSIAPHIIDELVDLIKDDK